ncbi:MAG: hypothetical protein FWD55_02170 [Propionibacteriaceae bacterium]|nr:hypothetical protein [Propionibacteriaceae bacterium]
MRGIFFEPFVMARDVLSAAFVKPVQDGRPHPDQWPRGLPAIGAAVLVVYVLLALAAVFAVPLRQHTTLVISMSSMNSLPQPAIWLLQCGVVLTMALLYTAALHTSWLLRLVLFVLGGFALFFFVAPAVITVPWVVFLSVLLYIGLFVFTIVRSRREFAWWEFVVITIVVGSMMLIPSMIAASSPTVFAGEGPALHIVGIEGTFASLGLLSYPVLMVAGAAPAQIVVTGAVAVTNRPVVRSLLLGITLLGLTWLTLSTILDWQEGSEDLSLSALAAGVVTWSLILGLLALWLKRGQARAPEEPSSFPDTWSSWLYPLAAAIAGVALVLIPLGMIIQVLHFAGSPELIAIIEHIWNGFSDNNPALLWRTVLGFVLIGIAWRISGRGRPTEAMLISVLAVSMIMEGLGLIPALAFLHEENTRMTGLLACAAAFVIGCILLIRRHMDAERAGLILAVVLLAVLYPIRNVLDDPAGTALYFSAPLILLFGLTWRVLSDAEFLDGDTRVFPRSTRVLLFMANTLFAATLVAFIALASATATAIDPSQWSDFGDWALGGPLYIGAMVACLWLAVRKKAPTPEQAPISA